MIVKGKAYKEYIVLNKNELAKCFAPRKYEIKEAMTELRCNKELPLKNSGYKPNYEKIKNVYAVNAVKLLKQEAEEKKRNKISAINNNNDIVAVPPPPIDIINNLYIGMLKQIILCDYKHTDFNPTSTDSALSSFTAVIKKRKKVRRLLTAKEQQQRSLSKYPSKPVNVDQLLIDENNIYDPDDDEEERQERRKLEEQRILWEQQITKCEQEAARAFMEEQDEIGSQLSDLLTQLPKRFIESKEKIDDIKLGLEIASKLLNNTPELGLTYKQLALDLFPELRTKEQEGVEFELYIQRIVRAIDAVQVYIISCFFRKRTIRIFPVALPSKEKDNVERVFNGYKKKYVDKVLCEFITIK
jgi:hypothetical protein